MKGKMKVTLLDTQTGNKRTFDSSFSPFWWAEGNGACDCNRAIKMGCDEELDRAMREDYPEIKGWQSYCYGAKRILIIETDCDEYSLEEFNADYPDELKAAYLSRHITEEHK